MTDRITDGKQIGVEGGTNRMNLEETLGMLLETEGDELRMRITSKGHLEVRWRRRYEGDDGKMELVANNKINPMPEFMLLTLREIYSELVEQGLIDPQETVQSISEMYREHYKYLCGCQLQEVPNDDEEVSRFRRVCPEHGDEIDPIGLKDMRKGLVRAGLA